MKNENHILDQLAHSEIFHDYVRAFNEATGMPLTLRPVESWKLAHQAGRRANPVCVMYAESSRTCAACLEARQSISDPEAREPQTTVCAAGLCEASVPVRSGERLLGFLQTGEVIIGKPSQRQFEKIKRQLRKWNAKVDVEKLKVAYFQTQALTAKHYKSVRRLLEIFAEHLGLVANQLTMRANSAEPASIVKARQFIDEHHEEELALSDVAKAIHMSTFYFCKSFKKATGFTFTDYLSRLRIEKAKELLVKPNLRVSEIAFAVGFQSLTHFIRTFHRLLGESPTEYRVALPK